MGWKASLIIIENKNNFDNEGAILKALGMGNYSYEKDILFEDCIYAKGKSIGIGYFKENIIVCDGYQITTKSLDKAENLSLIKAEKNLIKLFPNAEIISLACHSSVNYHAYSLIQNGEKKRLKSISTDNALISLGKRTKEEEEIYASSYRKDNQNYWKDEFEPEYDFTEDQMMEDFIFALVRRRLGVYIDSEEGEELLKTKFRKYIQPSFFKRFWKN